MPFRVGRLGRESGRYREQGTRLRDHSFGGMVDVAATCGGKRAPNNSMQQTALRAAADAERSASHHAILSALELRATRSPS